MGYNSKLEYFNELLKYKDEFLHNHTNLSDGDFNLERLFQLQSKINKILSLKNKNTIISITDHDILHNSKRLKEYINKYKFNYINGVEVSTNCSMNNNKTIELHILTYNIDDDKYSKQFKEILNYNLSERKKHGKIILKNSIHRLINDKYYSKKVIEMFLEHFNKDNNSKYISERLLGKSLENYFNLNLLESRLLKQRNIKPSYILTKDYLNFTKQSNNLVTYLAHPLKYLNNLTLNQLNKLIHTLKKYGLDGIELNPKSYFNKNVINSLVSNQKKNIGIEKCNEIEFSKFFRKYKSDPFKYDKLLNKSTVTGYDIHSIKDYYKLLIYYCQEN